MSSNRWRRFAFFDRSNITLSNEVIEELQLPCSNKYKENPTLWNEASATATNTKGEDDTATKDSSSNSNANANTTDLNQEDDTTATTATTATSDYSFTISCCSYKTCSETTHNTPETTRTTALTSTAVSSKNMLLPKSVVSVSALVQSTIGFPNNTTQFQSTVSSITSSTVMDIQDTKSIIRNNGSTTTTCVFLFLASKYTCKIFCYDVSSRCNNTTTTTEAGDGYNCGYWIPFPNEGTQSNTSNSLEQKIIDEHLYGETRGKYKNHERKESSDGGRIVGVASTGKPNGDLFLAVISDDCISTHGVTVYKNPHDHLLSLDTNTTTTASNSKVICYKPIKALRTSNEEKSSNSNQEGKACVVTIIEGYVAVGTDTGYVLVYTYPSPSTSISTSISNQSILVQRMEISPPPSNQHQNIQVTNVLLSTTDDKIFLYVTYSKKAASALGATATRAQTMGVCCFELGRKSSKNNNTSPLRRCDLDGRDVPYKTTSDVDIGTGNLVLSKSDGLYFYTPSKPSGVAPIDGMEKLVMCCVPSFDADPNHHTISSYTCVSSKDGKSGRDAVDVYDVNHKLVAFHVLLSPGYKALVAKGVTTTTTIVELGEKKSNASTGGRASAAILTSGGSILLLTEKTTPEKVALLLQKNLYTAAISLAYADPYYSREGISILYRKHAEFLYQTNDFESAMEQYIHTIGMSIVEPSHVIYRYLDAPKIPFLVKYLEALKEKNMAEESHLQLLHACYMKLNEVDCADRIQEEMDWRNARLVTNSAIPTPNTMNTGIPSSTTSDNVLSTDHTLTASLPFNDPLEAFKAISTMEAPQAVQALKVHGCTLARALPRETAGIVISLCDGTYSPNNLASAAAKTTNAYSCTSGDDGRLNVMERSCEKYPVHLFTSGFLENPKLLRLILAHCYRKKCALDPSLRRTLLELTLEEWKEAKNTISTSTTNTSTTTNTMMNHTNMNAAPTTPSDIEKLRASEALSILADQPNASEMGDYESLVIVQTVGFTEGEIFLYEKLQMSNMLLERYAIDCGTSERARRQMLALCRTDPELVADVLGYFVLLAASNCDLLEYDDTNTTDNANGTTGRICEDTITTTSESDALLILEDIQEVLEMAKGQGVLSPIRIARILAGENGNPFSSGDDVTTTTDTNTKSVPLSVALDYVGGILDDASKKIIRLKSEIEEYNHSCNAMEMEIQSLLHPTKSSTDGTETTITNSFVQNVNIEQMYELLQEDHNNSNSNTIITNDLITEQEEFWREMGQSDDRFETIKRFFGKGYIL